MKWFKELNSDNKVRVVMILVLSVFLIFWIALYPWDSKANKTDKKATNSDISSENLQSIVDGMTIDEKVYQMFIVSPEQITGVETVVAAKDATKKALEEYPVGGLIYSSKNMLDREQISEVISNSQDYAKINMFIAVNEEGGIENSNIMNAIDTPRVNPMFTYKDKGKKVAKKNARTIARSMRELGFNLDFAPVADVFSDPMNNVIGSRAYSDDFNKSGKLIQRAVAGFHKENVLCTLKHFPGYGEAAEYEEEGNDSLDENKKYYLLKTKKELEVNEYIPFKAGIRSGADLVMVGNMIVEDIDEKAPACLSEVIVTDMLRNDLGFGGLIITDRLDRIGGEYSSAELAVLAVKAGNDLLLEPENMVEAHDAIVETVNSGEIPQERIDAIVLHILEVKSKAGILY